MAMRKMSFTAALAAAALGACAVQPAKDRQVNPVPVASNSADLHLTSVPGAGRTVVGPVNQLIFDFDRPVALGEVVVDGPDGTMPMMVGSAGLQKHFEIPVSGLSTGNYKVSWRATLDGVEKRGNFAFTVK